MHTHCCHDVITTANCVVGHVNRTFYRLSVSPLTHCYSMATTPAITLGGNMRDLCHYLQILDTFGTGHFVLYREVFKVEMY